MVESAWDPHIKAIQPKQNKWWTPHIRSNVLRERRRPRRSPIPPVEGHGDRVRSRCTSSSFAGSAPLRPSSCARVMAARPRSRSTLPSHAARLLFHRQGERGRGGSREQGLGPAARAPPLLGVRCRVLLRVLARGRRPHAQEPSKHRRCAPHDFSPIGHRNPSCAALLPLVVVLNMGKI